MRSGHRRGPLRPPVEVGGADIGRVTAEAAEGERDGRPGALCHWLGAVLRGPQGAGGLRLAGRRGGGVLSAQGGTVAVGRPWTWAWWAAGREGGEGGEGQSAGNPGASASPSRSTSA